MNLQNNLREWRESASLSREQLAEKVGKTAVSIFRIEKGDQQPRPKLLSALCKVFNKAPSEFYSDMPNVVEVAEGNRWIPILDYVQAGEFAKIGERADDDYEDSILTDLSPSPNTFVLRLRGRSMLPEFREDDLVMIDPEIQPVAEDFVFAMDEHGEGSFKQYFDRGIGEQGEPLFELVSLNPAFPSWRSDRKKLHIIGTMIEHRRLRKPTLPQTT
jgi:phage repressor protein C with HTH and peptisase S24 domain